MRLFLCFCLLTVSCSYLLTQERSTLIGGKLKGLSWGGGGGVLLELVCHITVQILHSTALQDLLGILARGVVSYYLAERKQSSMYLFRTEDARTASVSFLFQFC